MNHLARKRWRRLIIAIMLAWFGGAAMAPVRAAPEGGALPLNKRALILVSAAFGAPATDRGWWRTSASWRGGGA